MLKWLIRIWFKQLIGIIWYFIPYNIKNRILRYRANTKSAYDVKNFMRFRVYKEEVIEAMKQLNINNDVLVHSSLVDIGNLEGGYKTFVNYLNDNLLKKGKNILSIAIPLKGSMYEYLKSTTTFSAKAPNAMGVISKYYMQRPDSVRSLNPTHSVIALGSMAHSYVDNHHLDTTPFTVNSPYYKLLEQNGSVLMIGAKIKHLTLCHLIEDLIGEYFPYDVYTKEHFKVSIETNEGTIYNGIYKAHSPFRSAIRVPDYIHTKIRNLSSTKIVPLGNSELILLNARDVVLCMLYELKAGMTIYGYCRITTDCKQKIDYWIEKISQM